MQFLFTTDACECASLGEVTQADLDKSSFTNQRMKVVLSRRPKISVSPNLLPSGPYTISKLGGRATCDTLPAASAQSPYHRLGHRAGPRPATAKEESVSS